MKTLCLLLIMFVSSLLIGQDKNYQAVEGATHRIHVLDVFAPNAPSHCSATAVASHALLTAGHCEDNSDTVLVDGKPAYIMFSINDGHDHAILLLNGITFKKYVAITQRPLVVSEDIFMVGNPKALSHLYRRGTVIGDCPFGTGDDDVADASSPDVDVPQHKKLKEYVLDINGFFGDSGAGIFDSKGNLVGVVSSRKTLTFKDSEAVYFMGATDMVFTPGQLSIVEGFGTE